MDHQGKVSLVEKVRHVDRPDYYIPAWDVSLTSTSWQMFPGEK